MTLILVHVVMLLHLAQWLITGLTLSPVEPSESMYTLRDGMVNAGFVFFVLAIIATFVFGRFFCGWGCHIVAVQDLCAWIMMRLGIKPRPFRSRLLLLVPAGLAIYMFVWPVVVREVVRPLLADASGRLPDWLGQIDPLAGVRSAFLVQDFWATFAPWYVAIPFVLTCGVATVYFLGAKAFCTYGCPYGGIFAPVDLLAVGRIRVTDACHHCGHCTSVCTSNVRVHEEVRDFGMVVDPGCMKCLDCVSVCPNDALYFGAGKPAIFAKPREGAKESAARARAMKRARWDLSWPEEIAAGTLFVVLFVCSRGMFNQVPMLMAVAMGGLGAWAAWKSWRLLRDANSRVHGFQFKYRGKLSVWGYGFVAATLLCLAAAGWSGYIRWNRFCAQIAYQKIQTPIDVVLRPDFAPGAADIANARAALEFYRRGGPLREGGVALLWPLASDELVNITYLHLIAGDDAAAERAMQGIIDRGHPRDGLVFQLAQVMDAQANRTAMRMQMLGVAEAEIAKFMDAARNQIEAMFDAALARHEDLMGVRAHVLGRRLAAGDRAGALAEWARTLRSHPRSFEAHLTAAGFYREAQDLPAARDALDKALAQHDPRPDQIMNAAGLLDALGQRPRAVTLVERAADQSLKLPMPRAAAAQIMLSLAAPEQAQALASRAVELARAKPMQEGSAGAMYTAARVFLSLGQEDRAISLVREAAELPGVGAWDLASMGEALVEPDARGNRPAVLREAERLLEKARDANPDAPSVRHALARAYGFDGRIEDALREMRSAAERATTSVFLADRYAALLEETGRGAEAARWREFATERAAHPADSNP